jgi:hypothetical protein
MKSADLRCRNLIKIQATDLGCWLSVLVEFGLGFACRASCWEKLRRGGRLGKMHTARGETT